MRPPHHEQPTAERLAAEAQTGRAGAFDELARRVSPWLMHYLRRRCPTPQDAEDLHQETLMRAYRFLGRYDPARPIRPWLKAIAARLVTDHARQRSLRRAETLADDPACRREPGEALRAAEFWRIAAAQLPDRQFAVLRLRYQQQLTVGEIATRLGLSQSNVKVMLFRARRTLADSPAARALLDH